MSLRTWSMMEGVGIWMTVDDWKVLLQRELIWQRLADAAELCQTAQPASPAQPAK